MQNKYIKRSHISEKKFREILKYFCCDETSNKTAIYTNISRNTVNKIFDKIRKRIFSALFQNEWVEQNLFTFEKFNFPVKK